MLNFFNAIGNFLWPVQQPVCNSLDWMCRDSNGLLRVWLPDALEPVLNFVVENSTPVNAVAVAVGIGVSTYVGYNYSGLIFRKKDTQKTEPPAYFNCPIGFEIMTDPMITPTGHTFQRDQIERHLRSNKFDPLDRSPCTIKQLAPNLALREDIEAWLDLHPDYERKEGIVRRNKK